MRFLLGLIFGIALTVGLAWAIDHMGSGGPESRLVNWERVEQTVDGVRQAVRFGLLGKLDNIQIQPAKTERQGQFDDFALTPRNAQSLGAQILEHPHLRPAINLLFLFVPQL